jgi:hypothetical protein
MPSLGGQLKSGRVPYRGAKLNTGGAIKHFFDNAPVFHDRQRSSGHLPRQKRLLDVPVNRIISRAQEKNSMLPSIQNTS